MERQTGRRGRAGMSRYLKGVGSKVKDSKKNEMKPIKKQHKNIKQNNINVNKWATTQQFQIDSFQLFVSLIQTSLTRLRVSRWLTVVKVQQPTIKESAEQGCDLKHEQGCKRNYSAKGWRGSKWVVDYDQGAEGTSSPPAGGLGTLVEEKKKSLWEW